MAFVWQEGGALPVALSNAVQELKGKGLLRTVVSCGNCFGGDLEAVNVYSGLLAAAEVADLVLVGIGPGILGTGTPEGHGGMAAAIAANAALSLGGEPVLAPRISGADPRGRHRGLSHHTRAALAAILGGCRVAFPLAILPGSSTGRSLIGRSRSGDPDAPLLRAGALRGGWIGCALRGNLREYGAPLRRRHSFSMLPQQQ